MYDKIMLMDNSGIMGGGTGFETIQDPNKKAPITSGDFDQLRPDEVAGNFDAFVNSGAVVPPAMERPNELLGATPENLVQSSAEQLNNGEKVSDTERRAEVAEQKMMMPPVAKFENMPTAQATNDPLAEDLDALEKIEVQENSERAPNAFIYQYEDGIDKRLKNGKPGEAVEFSDKARWSYMRRCFNRNLGDGLNGKGA